jgi:hypothetical protein
VNRSRDIHDITKAYEVLLENEDNKVWKSGDCPEALGDSPMADDLKPDNPCSTSDSECVTGGKAITPEEAGDDNELYLKKISERLKENRKKHGKIAREQINNSELMSDEPNNIFDKLYSTIMEGENPFADLDDMGADDGLEGDDMGGDDELDLGGDEITLNLPRDVAQQLCDMLMDQLGEGGEEADDNPFGDESEDDEMLGDSVVSQPEPKPLGGHGDRQHKDAGNTGSGSNKVAGAAAPDAGNAEHGKIDEDPTPKPLGGHGDRQHKDAGNTGSGSNKVNNPKTKAPGN